MHEHLSNTNAFALLHNLSRIGKKYKYVLYARSIRYVIEARGKDKEPRRFQSSYPNFSSTGHLRLMCLIARVADNPVNFQTVIEKKKVSVSLSYSSAV